MVLKISLYNLHMLAFYKMLINANKFANSFDVKSDA